MEPVKVIDLWQVILQEPRVAAQEDALILQGELEQYRLREKLDKHAVRNQKRVLKSYQSHTKIRISEKKNQARKKIIRYSARKEKVNKEAAEESFHRPNVISDDHVDVIV